MATRKRIACISLYFLVSLPLWGGTGRPSDGFLSFILLLGFLGTLLGIISLVDLIKLKIRKFLEEIELY